MNKRTIITVVGKDTVGIIAKVCTYLADTGVNILDISQTIVSTKLNELTGAPIPAPLASLKDKKVRFTDVCNKEDMSQMVFKLLDL